MLLRQQLRPSTGLQHCPSTAAAGALLACRRCRTASGHKAAVRLLTPPAATAAAADTAPAGKKSRKHTPRKKDAEQQPAEPPEPDLPMVRSTKCTSGHCTGQSEAPEDLWPGHRAACLHALEVLTTAVFVLLLSLNAPTNTLLLAPRLPTNTHQVLHYRWCWTALWRVW